MNPYLHAWMKKETEPSMFRSSSPGRSTCRLPTRIEISLVTLKISTEYVQTASSCSESRRSGLYRHLASKLDFPGLRRRPGFVSFSRGRFGPEATNLLTSTSSADHRHFDRPATSSRSPLDHRETSSASWAVRHTLTSPSRLR